MTLTRAIDTPDGPRTDFTLPDKPTLGLFRGIRLADLEASRIDGDAMIRLTGNLLGLPDSFAEQLDFDQFAEVMKAARPLLQQAGASSLMIGNSSPAT